MDTCRFCDYPVDALPPRVRNRLLDHQYVRACLTCRRAVEIGHFVVAIRKGQYSIGAVCCQCRSQHVRFRRQKGPRRRDPVSPKTRFLILKRDSYRCQICGARASDDMTLEVDHRIPVAKGGLNTDDNLWTLCAECNAGKQAMDL
jgi:5-methylcytosine-specific restriction endonuclease McrA